MNTNSKQRVYVVLFGLCLCVQGIPLHVGANGQEQPSPPAMAETDISIQQRINKTLQLHGYEPLPETGEWDHKWEEKLGQYSAFIGKTDRSEIPTMLRELSGKCENELGSDKHVDFSPQDMRLMYSFANETGVDFAETSDRKLFQSIREAYTEDVLRGLASAEKFDVEALLSGESFSEGSHPIQIPPNGPRAIVEVDDGKIKGIIITDEAGNVLPTVNSERSIDPEARTCTTCTMVCGKRVCIDRPC